MTNTATSVGTWQDIQFGAGTSAASATALAGLGLVALPALPNGTLNTNIPVQSKNAAYTIVAGDRASLIVWAGGTGTITLPLITSVPAGFNVSFNNQGTGILSLTTVDVPTPAHIDSVAPPLMVQIDQSLTIVSDGTQWWSLGLSQIEFVNGGVADPSIHFASDSTTGFYYTPNGAASSLGVTVLGINVATFASGVGTGLTLTNPLAITSGGTGQTTAPNALNALMPMGAMAGTFIYYNGANWISFAPPVNGTYTINFAAGVPTWVAAQSIPLPVAIASGGTGQTTAPNALNALMPAASAGDLIVYNGANWVPVPFPGAGTYYIVFSGSGVVSFLPIA